MEATVGARQTCGEVPRQPALQGVWKLNVRERYAMDRNANRNGRKEDEMSEEKCQKCWNGEYPLFIEWNKSMQMEFVEEEAELIEFCASHRLNPYWLRYYEAEPMYAWEGVHIDTEELENDDGEVDEEVQALIDEFRQKLREIKRPIIHWASDRPIKVSASLLEEWYAKVKGNLA